MVLQGIALYCIVLHGIAWYCMALHGIAWYCMVLHCITWYCIVLHGITWYHLVLHGITWYHMALHGIAWYCMILHAIAWYCMVLHGIAWYCMVLHMNSTIPYCSKGCSPSANVTICLGNFWSSRFWVAYSNVSTLGLGHVNPFFPPVCSLLRSFTLLVYAKCLSDCETSAWKYLRLFLGDRGAFGVPGAVLEYLGMFWGYWRVCECFEGYLGVFSTQFPPISTEH